MIMVSKKGWTVINLSLILVALLLILNLFSISWPSFGKSVEQLQSESFCWVNWQEQYTLWPDLDACCLEARKQLQCETSSNLQLAQEQLLVCQTGSGPTVQYWLNSAAYQYCQKQVFW